MSATGRPFDDFRALLPNMPEADALIMARARQMRRSLPAGSLGRLEEIAVWLCGWRGQEKPLIMRPVAVVFAGSHGIADNIALYPQNLTKQRAENCAKGGGAVSQICLANDLGLKIYDLALDYPTENIETEAAMDERSCAATMAFGMEAVQGGADLLCLGAIGTGNEVSAAAIACLLFGGEAEDWLEPNAEEDGVFYRSRLAALRRALAQHRPFCAEADSFEALRRVGGREIAAIIGAVLAARMEKIPVILDGFACAAAAAILYRANPRALDHCLAGHVCAGFAHRKMLELIDKKPLLDLGLRSEEGAGAAMAAGIVKAAALCHAQMTESPAAEAGDEYSRNTASVE